MSDEPDPDLQAEVRRGAFVNALGVVGKMAGPAFLIVVTRLYGADAFGVFISAMALIEMAIALLTAGFKDGALLFVARHAGSRDEEKSLYQALANALVFSAMLAVVLVAIAFFVASDVLPRLYPYGTRLTVVLQVMSIALPFMIVDRVVVAATQGLRIMRYEAMINGGIRPILLVATAVAFWYVLPDERGLSYAYLATQGTVALVAVAVYTRELLWQPLLRALRHFRVNRELVSFAIPQNLNMTFERFITNVDIVMLGMFNVSAFMVGFYGAGAMIVREIRQLKMIYTGALAPHIVRLYSNREYHTLARMASLTSYWIARLAVPVLLAIAILRNDLVELVSQEFAGQDTLFMLFLLVIPYLQCTLGVAGNVVVMTGHSRMNLLNSVATGATNVVLNILFIPGFGLVGAALASAISAFIRAVLEVLQMRILLRVPYYIREMIAPHAAGLLAVAVVAGMWVATPLPLENLSGRIVVLAVSLVVFLGALVLLRPRVGLNE